MDVHIRRLRKALETSGYDRFVQTVRGAGYRFSRRKTAPCPRPGPSPSRRLATAIAAAIGLGLIFGRIWLWVTVVLGGLLCVQLVNLYRLQRWLRHRSHQHPPDFGGVWGDVISQIGRIYRRKQFHKRRVVQLFREFRRLSAALPDGVVLLSRNHEILWFNRMAGQLLGLQRKADLGMPIENLVRQPEFSSYIRGHGGGAGVVVRMQGAELSLALIVIPAGGQLLMLARDVTRESRLEQMRKDFVANASHELRSPLTVISGYLDAARRGFESWRGMARADRGHAAAGRRACARSSRTCWSCRAWNRAPTRRRCCPWTCRI